MEIKSIHIAYQEFNSIEELNQTEQKLAYKAIEAQQNSYAPYSNFNVGAAVLMKDGQIICGSNQENAAYPSGLCAERTALFAAGSLDKNSSIEAIALVGGENLSICEEPISPCGACRQVMAEYEMRSNKPLIILLIGKNKIKRFEKVQDLLPLIFNSLKIN